MRHCQNNALLLSCATNHHQYVINQFLYFSQTHNVICSEKALWRLLVCFGDYTNVSTVIVVLEYWMLTPPSGANSKSNNSHRYQIDIEMSVSCLQEIIVAGVSVSDSDSLSLSASPIKAKQQIPVSLIFHYRLSCFIPQGSSLSLVFCLFLFSTLYIFVLHEVLDMPSWCTRIIPDYTDIECACVCILL